MEFSNFMQEEKNVVKELFLLKNNTYVEYEKWEIPL